MKIVILCGGRGARLAGSEDIPKALAMVNGKPLIWHVMKIYSRFGFNDFILPLGYKGHLIKEYFVNYQWKNFNFVKNTSEGKIKLLEEPENWDITFIDTGLDTMTGGRIKKIQKYIDGDTFMLTYCDGLSDININNLLKYHREKDRIATVTGIERKSQYGILTVENGIAKTFEEKSTLDGIINGGFFIASTQIFQYLSDDENCTFEQEPIHSLIRDGQLAVYNHKGFWLAVDTQKDLIAANQTWITNS